MPVNKRLLFIAGSYFSCTLTVAVAPMRKRMIGIGRGELDAHRHALRDLYPVAGGVLRRQQRKRGSGPAAEAFHRSLEVLAGIHVDLDVHILAGTDAVQFGFLEVGIDMETVLLDQREQRFADADQRSCCKREIADLSVLRRRDMGMLQIELGLLDRGLRLQHISALFGLLRCGKRLGQFGARLFQRSLQGL